MRFRSMVAGLVAVLLLSISCVASACEASCYQEAADTGCHGQSPAVSAPAMTGMHDGGMNLRSETCAHRVCEQQPQVVESEQAATNFGSLATLHAFIAVLVSAESLESIRIAPSDTSPPRVPFLIALQTTLRV